VESRGVAHRVLVGKLDGSRPPGRSEHRLEDNIKMIFKKWVGSRWLRIRTGGVIL